MGDMCRTLEYVGTPDIGRYVILEIKTFPDAGADEDDR